MQTRRFWPTGFSINSFNKAHLRWLTVGLLGLCLILPILSGLIGIAILASGVWPDLKGNVQPGLATWLHFTNYPAIFNAILRTQMIGLFSSLGAVFFCFCALSLLYDTRHFGFLHRCLIPFISIPHLALGVGILFLLSPAGVGVRFLAYLGSGWDRPPDIALLPDLYGWGVGLTLLIKEIAFLLLVCIAILPSMELGKYVHIGQTMGYSRMACWGKVIWPLLYSRLRLPIYAVIAYGSSVADLPQILLAGNTPTLSVTILGWAGNADLSYHYLAAVGAIVQLLIVIVNIALMRGFEKAGALLCRVFRADGRRWQHPICNRVINWFIAGHYLIFLGIGASSMAVLLVWSCVKRWPFPALVPTQWRLSYWGKYLPEAWPALVNSFAFAGIAALIGLVLVCLVVETEAKSPPKTRQQNLFLMGKSWLIFTPLLVPQIAFLFGVQFLLVMAGQHGTFWAIIWAHLVFVIPYLYLSLATPLRRFDNRYIQLGQSLGKKPFVIFWRVKFPMLLSPFLMAFAIGFAVSIGAYLPTFFAGAGRYPTLITEGVGLASGGNRQILAIFAILQALLPFAIFALALCLPRYILRQQKFITAGYKYVGKNRGHHS